MSKSEYFRLSTHFNKKIVSIFDKISDMVEEGDDVVLGDKELYNKIGEIYALMTLKYQLFYNLENKKKQQEEPKTYSAPQVSESEKTRLLTIKKANDLYKELYLDWIRDLDSQVPYSTKDKAELIKEKYIKLAERFNLPLRNDTSLGQAKEVCNQINNLMNNISELSSQSYNINAYKE